MFICLFLFVPHTERSISRSGALRSQMIKCPKWDPELYHKLSVSSSSSGNRSKQMPDVKHEGQHDDVGYTLSVHFMLTHPNLSNCNLASDWLAVQTVINEFLKLIFSERR